MAELYNFERKAGARVPRPRYALPADRPPRWHNTPLRTNGCAAPPRSRKRATHRLQHILREFGTHMKASTAQIRVFISYSHDSAQHVNDVLALSNELRESGLDCWIDQYDE